MRSLIAISASLLLSLACLSSASEAAALEVRLLSPDNLVVPLGGTFSIDLAVDNASEAAVLNVELRVRGSYAAGMLVTSGRASNRILLVDFGGFVFGLPTVGCDGCGYDPTDFTMGRQPSRFLDDALVGLWAGVSGIRGDGSLDGGIDGIDVLDPQPRDSTITFLATELGLQTLTVIRGWSEELPDGTFIWRELEPIEISVNVVPEPGTALLLGLGLLALSNRDRT